MSTTAPAAQEKPAKKPRTRFFWIRVSILLTILFGVSLYAIHDYRSRHARNDWDRTLEVSFIVVRAGAITNDALEALKARVPALEAQLLAQMKRYKPTNVLPPIHVTIRGPVDGIEAPPDAGDGLWSNLKYEWSLWRWTRKVDSAAGFDPGDADSRIYLVASPPVPEGGRIVRQIEGISEKNGRVGVVRVDLDRTMADFTLFVATHELLHTLGASDKYASDGSILVPQGLPEPSLVPLYPQRYAEIMARHRAVAEGQTKPPASLAELAVGTETAKEIGWLK